MKLSIVVPCYNEASRLNTSKDLFYRLDRIKSINDNISNCVEFIFVNDGSTDNTYNIIHDFITEYNLINWKIYSFSENRGKGEAISYGFSKSKSDYVGFMDADLAVPISTIYSVLPLLNKKTCFIASRYVKGSRIATKRPFIRRLVSKISRLITKYVFGLKVTDTQCGFKVFPSGGIHLVDSFSLKSRWLYDIELLYGMQVLGYKFKELGVTWLNDEDTSRLSLNSHFSNILHDFVSIFNNCKTMKELL